MFAFLATALASPAAILRAGLLAAAVIIACLVGYSVYRRGAEAEIARQRQVEDDIREAARENRRATERLIRNHPIDDLMEERKWMRPDE